MPEAAWVYLSRSECYFSLGLENDQGCNTADMKRIIGGSHEPRMKLLTIGFRKDMQNKL